MIRRALAAAAACAVACSVAPDASAAISISISASRTTCAAPCQVFFDATGSTGLSDTTARLTNGDWVRASWTWDFNDPTSPVPTAISAIPAHMFENAGTYNVVTSVIDASGATAGPVTTTITVSAMSGTSYYASGAGSGSTCSTGSPCSFATARGLATTNDSVLLKRGDTYAFGASELGISGKTGPINYGAWSTGANPILTWASSTGLRIANSTDIRIIDWTLQLSTAFTTCAAVGEAGAVTNLAFLRMDCQGDKASGSGTNLIYWAATGSKFGVFDSHIHTVTGYGLYYNSPVQAALVNSTIDDLAGAYHAYRWQACTQTASTVADFTGASCPSDRVASKLFVSGNTLSGAPSQFDAGTVRGTTFDFAIVNNSADATQSAGPQNTTSDEPIMNGLFENNTVRSAALQGTCHSPNAKHIVLRNNTYYGCDQAISTGSTTALDAGNPNWVGEIYAYNNTMFYPSTCAVAAVKFMVWSNASNGTIELRNNILYSECANVHGFGTSPFMQAGSATVTEDHNLTYSVDSGGFTPPGGTGDVNANPSFVSMSLGATYLRLTSGSPARNVGSTLAAYRDGAGALRPAGAFDIGAFEYVAPSTYVPGKGRVGLFGGF